MHQRIFAGTLNEAQHVRATHKGLAAANRVAGNVGVLRKWGVGHRVMAR